jgi:hypothetical protein
MNDNCILFIDDVEKEHGNKNPFIDDGDGDDTPDSTDSTDSTPNQNITMNVQRIEQKDVSHIVPEIHSIPVKNSRRFFLCCCNNKDTV